MGQYRIVIEGVGSHHNAEADVPHDANRLLQEFTHEMVTSGHSLRCVTITSLDHKGVEQTDDLLDEDGWTQSRYEPHIRQWPHEAYKQSRIVLKDSERGVLDVAVKLADARDDNSRDDLLQRLKTAVAAMRDEVNIW